MEVRIVKLITGEEILTQVVDYSDIPGDVKEIKLVKPMVLIMQQGGLQMVPWLMLSKQEEVVIRNEHIVMSYEPKNEIANAYRQQVGSIVAVPANALDGKGKLVL